MDESVSPDTPRPARPRQKRSQVSRACDWCRAHRIKCDNNSPCMNCQSRGGECNNGMSSEIRTLPQALREIERLKRRIRELEQKLGDRNREASPTPDVTTPSGLVLGQAISSKRCWGGIFTSTARSPAKTWYGPSSLFYFTDRLKSLLSSTLQQRLPERYMQPNSASRQLDGPTIIPPKRGAHELSRASPDDYLTPTQEEYFLESFWQSYHTSLVILDEDAFKQHYKSLWVGSGKNRKPSALVDIVIAVCMQYEMARSHNTERSTSWSADIDTDDATIAGRRHYCRCQSLLAAELESPTIPTLQCFVLSAIWLCCASFQNMADSTIALAVRTAQMLGLHLQPPRDMALREKEMRRRLWWSLYVLETKTSMKLGRPFLLHLADACCGLPSDDPEVALTSGSIFAPLSHNVSWLSWNLHSTKLVLVVRHAYTVFYDIYSKFSDGDSSNAFCEKPNALEAYVNLFIPQTKVLDRWVEEVPEELKTQRQNHGIPFSTDCSSIDIEKFAPLWVQRQRLLLELLYHNLSVILYRPFISFYSGTAVQPSGSFSSSPTSSLASPSVSSFSESYANKCVSHAMALTQITHQVLSTTSILTGYQEVFQWQWNCAMTLIGFVLAYPGGQLAQAAREVVGTSIEVLDMFGAAFPQGASAANVVRGLSLTIHRVVSQLGSDTVEEQLGPNEGGEPQSRMIDRGGHSTTLLENSGNGIPELDEETMAAMETIMSGSMDMMFAADHHYNSTSILWPNLGPFGS